MKYSVEAGLAQWKKCFSNIGVTREDVVENMRRQRISNKTYSTYAVNHKFRAKYISLKIGTVESEEEEKKKIKEIPKHPPLKWPLPKGQFSMSHSYNFQWLLLICELDAN